MEYQDFVKFMLKLTSHEESEDSLLQAFRVFDETDMGLISEDLLRHILTKLGEGEDFTEEEVDRIIQSADANERGMIKYDGKSTVIETSQFSYFWKL